MNALDLSAVNERLESVSAEERVAWALEQFKPGIVLSSSFGAQAAVSLHLVTRLWPEIPVVLLDTQYLFGETYRFVDELTERLGLNLRVYKSDLSAAWQEARFGKLWENGVDGITRYNQINKVEPMERALNELGAQAWFAGLRRDQASTRRALPVVAEQNGRVKIHPIVDWSDRDVDRYLKAHKLPYHPLFFEGYESIGDWHTSRPVSADVSAEESRFFGLKRECGLHEPASADQR